MNERLQVRDARAMHMLSCMLFNHAAPVLGHEQLKCWARSNRVMNSQGYDQDGQTCHCKLHVHIHAAIAPGARAPGAQRVWTGGWQQPTLRRLLSPPRPAA